MKQARVSYSVTRTISARSSPKLEDYESVKVQAGLEVQCDRTDAAIESAYEEIKEFVDDRITEETAKWQQ